MALAVIGVSYAAFNYSKLGEKVNSITTGAIMMSYEESDNVINLDKALPTKDSAGTTRLKEGEYFDFTISSTISGNVNINYEISAKDVTDSSARKIDGSNIKLYLTRLTDDGEEELMSPETYNEEASENSYTGRPANEMSLYTSSMNSSETNNYRLRMYVTEEYNPQGDGGGLTFAVKINVYGKDGEKPLSAGETIIDNLSNGSTYNDEIDTFITGEDPNNYVWYSGKLWRAVSVNNSTNTTKLVTQWNISAIPYDDDSSDFSGSHMEMWLNDETEDGFLGNLREPEKFIVTDSMWDVTPCLDVVENEDIIERPNETSTVTDAVGLLNLYEFQSSYHGIDSSNNIYLNNGTIWRTLTSRDDTHIHSIDSDGFIFSVTDAMIDDAYGIRPAINLKSSISIVSGDGTKNNPYRLNGDNDANLTGTLLNTRYSGEYIRFGVGENNLYRIVSHEVSGLTKITSDEPLKENGNYKEVIFDINDNHNYSISTTIGEFLNGEYLNSGTYFNSEQVNMIDNDSTWYLGVMADGYNYRLTKYGDVNMNSFAISTPAKVGLLRVGELMAAPFEMSSGYFWLLTSDDGQNIYLVFDSGETFGDMGPTSQAGVKPSFNLKSNVVITGGTGTKEDPFIIALQ